MPITETRIDELTSSDGSYTVKITQSQTYGDDDDIDFDNYAVQTTDLTNNITGENVRLVDYSGTYDYIREQNIEFTPDSRCLIFAYRDQDGTGENYLSYKLYNVTNDETISITSRIYSNDKLEKLDLSDDGSKIFYNLKTFDEFDRPITIRGVTYVPTVPQVTAAVATGAGIASGNGTVTVGETVKLTLSLVAVESVADPEKITLTLNTGAIARYDAAASDASKTLVFSYTVRTDEFVSDLGIEAIDLNGAVLQGEGGKAVLLDGALLNIDGRLSINGYTGTATNETFRGTAGAETFRGLGGDDAYLVNNAGDLVLEASGGGVDLVVSTISYQLAADWEIETLQLAQATGSANLNLTGNGFANTLRGNAGANLLDGSTGADALYGKGGADTYVIDNAGDRVFEGRGGGIDTVIATTSYRLAAGQEIETLQLARATGSANLHLTGNEFANTLRGNAGANLLDGQGGADALYGKGGNDTYAVDNSGDRVFEAAGQGSDTIVSLISYALASGQEIETLQLAKATGSAALKLVGNEFANTLRGNGGANVLDGRGGADALYGLGGNDTYRIDNAGDRVFEARGGGTDTVVSTISYRLAEGQEIEGLQLAESTGTAGHTLVGNTLANTISGNAGADTLAGGLGNDRLAGKGGADSFVFNTALGAGNVDRIADFSHADDTIRLSRSIFSILEDGRLPAEWFKDLSVAGAVIDRDDRILYDRRDGTLSYDLNGSDAGGRFLFAVLDNRATIDHTDFFVA